MKKPSLPQFLLILIAASLPKAALPASRGDSSSCAQSYANLEKSETHFTQSRDLGDYIRALDDSFLTALNEILARPGTHWLDAGGGTGVAARKFLEYSDSGQTHVTVLAYHSNARPQPYLNVMQGRFLEEIPDAEIPMSDLITDVFGPLAYSSRPDVVLKKYLSRLKDEGRIFTFLGSADELYGKQNQVLTADGQILNFAEWLERIPGLEVKTNKRQVPTEFSSLEIWSTEIRMAPGKTPQIPELETLRFEDGIPPKLILRETGAGRSRIDDRLCEARGRVTRDFSGNMEKLPSLALLESFRAGSWSHPLLSAVKDLSAEEKWVNFGGGGTSLAQDLARNNGELSGKSVYSGLGQSVMDWRIHSAFENPRFSFRQARATDELPQNGTLTLLTDLYGPFLTNFEPDATLRRYTASLSDGGSLFLYLGDGPARPGRQIRILTPQGEILTLSAWLKKIPGLKVTEEVIQDDQYQDVFSFARIQIGSRNQIKIPKLELLGLGPKSSEGIDSALFQEVKSE